MSLQSHHILRYSRNHELIPTKNINDKKGMGARRSNGVVGNYKYHKNSKTINMCRIEKETNRLTEKKETKCLHCPFEDIETLTQSEFPIFSPRIPKFEVVHRLIEEIETRQQLA